MRHQRLANVMAMLLRILLSRCSIYHARAERPEALTQGQKASWLSLQRCRSSPNCAKVISSHLLRGCTHDTRGDSAHSLTRKYCDIMVFKVTFYIPRTLLHTLLQRYTPKFRKHSPRDLQYYLQSGLILSQATVFCCLGSERAFVCAVPT